VALRLMPGVSPTRSPTTM